MNMLPNHCAADAGDAVPVSHLSGDGASRPLPARVGQPRTTLGQTPRPGGKKRRRKKRLLPILFMLIFVAAPAGWWWYAYGRVGSGEPVAQTAVVERRDFASSVLATGAVKPQVGAEVRVGARLSGKVAKLSANIGDQVTRGQVIAEIEKEDLEAMLAQREAELQLAEAKLSAVHRLFPKEIERAKLDIARWQATCTLGELEVARETNLRRQNITSEATLEQAQERLAIAAAQLATAETAHELVSLRYEEDLKQAAAEVARAQSAVANARVQLAYATITAPIDGVIASVSTQEGETVAAGFNAPTFVTIIDLDRLQVDAYVDEVDIGKVRLGQEAMFTVDTFPGREFRGKVSAIYPKAIIQDNVVNYDVVIDILDPHDGELRPEMTASVTVLLQTKTDVLAIPAKAIKRERGKNVVYVSVEGQPEPREVKVGWKDGPWIEVLGGLEEGQTIFVELPLEPYNNPPQT
jgi:HlyD family secretion protein